MGDFFKGWRRKVGVVALLMACLFMAGWVRSLVVQDDFDFHDFIDMSYVSLPFDALVTTPHSLTLLTSEFTVVYEFVTIPATDHSQVTSAGGSRSDDDVNIDWQNDQPTVDRRKALQVQQVPLLEIPYSAIVIPLTLISLWLLIFKPGKSNQKKITEPISESAA